MAAKWCSKEGHVLAGRAAGCWLGTPIFDRQFRKNGNQLLKLKTTVGET